MPECKLEAEQLVFPAGLVMQSYDLGVILGNALDNAVEACRKVYAQGVGEKLFIRLSSFQRGNQFFMKVVNMRFWQQIMYGITPAQARKNA